MLDTWFALTVHPKHELLAERGLRNHGFDVYVPMHRARRRWSDRVKTVDCVLFPGYVFCRFEAQDKLRVLTSPSVRGVVSTGRDPIPVAQSEIDAIRAVISRGRPIDLCPYLHVGAQVRISHGPFAGVRGIIVRAQDNWRVVISVEALGCSASLELDATEVEPDRNPLQAASPERILHGHLQA